MTGGLIELNAHMATPAGAMILITVGTTIAASACFVGVVLALIEAEWRIAAVFAAIVLLGAAMIAIGVRIPKDRIITAYAGEEVNIGQVAEMYEVIEMDGKLLRLRERQEGERE